MRTNIEIDDELMAKAMQAGPYATKRETVEAGLRLLVRQAAYREILKWEGKLKWEGDESIDWTQSDPECEDADETVHDSEMAVQEPGSTYRTSMARQAVAAPRHVKAKPDGRR